MCEIGRGDQRRGWGRRILDLCRKGCVFSIPILLVLLPLLQGVIGPSLVPGLWSLVLGDKTQKCPFIRVFGLGDFGLGVFVFFSD